MLAHLKQLQAALEEQGRTKDDVKLLYGEFELAHWRGLDDEEFAKLLDNELAALRAEINSTRDFLLGRTDGLPETSPDSELV